MKRILTIALLLTGISFGAFAQQPVKKDQQQKRIRPNKEMMNRTPEEMAKKRTDMLDKDLKFTTKQREEVYKLQLDQAKKHKQIQERRKQEREQSRKEFGAHKDKFEKILTPEQKEIYKNKISKNSRAKFKNGKEGQHRRIGVDSLRRKRA